MRITPLDIRQKTFEKNFRGYEKDEVNAFLLTLSQEWERILDENKEARIKLEAAEREVTKLREVEGSLYKTLKTAEDTGANVIEQARTAADLHLRQSQLQAEEILLEAKTRARDMIDESDMRAREIMAEMEDRLKVLVDNYKMMITSRDDLLGNFKHLASEALERVERSRSMIKDFDPDKHMAMARRETKKMFPNPQDAPPAYVPRSEPRPESPRPEPVVEKEIVLEERTMQVEPAQKKVQKSFFDEIG